MGDAHEGRWTRRARSAAGVRGLAFALPVGISVVATTLVNWALPAPHSSGQRFLWWVLLLVAAVGALRLGDRLARRLLPLAALLGLSLVFPDRAPSRFGMALRSGSSRQRQRRLDELLALEPSEAPSAAAGLALELVAGLTVHDRITRGHSERVRAYAELMAEELGLDPTERDGLRWAAMLHDVGKMAVPAAVLNKAGPLDDEDRRLLRTHPTEGERLTAPLRPWLGPSAGAVGEHHEWWDGSGYPRGRRGEEISPAARIVAVADAFEVMTAARPYKRAMGADAARRELVAGAGGQFDPAMVRAFLNISLGRLRAAAGLLGWLGQLPFLGRVAIAPFTAPAIAGAAAATILVAGGFVDVALPGPRDAPKVFGATLTRPDGEAAVAPDPLIAAEAAAALPAPAPPPVGAARAGTTRPEEAPAAAAARPVAPAAPDPVASSPAPSPTGPAPPAPTAATGQHGPCTAYFNGSATGRANKHRAPPAQTLAGAADANGQTVDKHCGVTRTDDGTVVNSGQVDGNPDYSDPTTKTPGLCHRGLPS
jgi:putative nucleotidyltransferase with HDIG domain